MEKWQQSRFIPICSRNETDIINFHKPRPPVKTILVVNPGSTSTKLAVAHDGVIVREEIISHAHDECQRPQSVWEQFPHRLDICKEWILQYVTKCDAVVAVGGLFRPVEGGTYHVNQKMIDDVRANRYGEHASNLGCAVADVFAEQFNCPAFVVDPVSVDEFEPLAYYSGHPSIKRKSLSHALSIHAIVRRASEELRIPLEKSSYVVAHLGGGISIAPVRSGKIIDANDAASDGPFSPERSGGLPLQAFISLCCSNGMSEAKLRSFVMGKGGLVAYLGTNSVAETEERISRGDTTAREVLEAMAYQIAKEIGAMSTVLNGKPDAILLTGGIARSAMVTSRIEERVRFIAPVIIYPGGDEMASLAHGALRVLRGEEIVKEY
jgi:butyrate kinase